MLSGRKLWLLLFGDLLRFMSDMQQSNAADHMLDVKNIKGKLTEKKTFGEVMKRIPASV